MRVAAIGLFVVAAACGDVVKTQPDAPDVCATATCECTPETEVADCGEYAVCDITGPGRVCACQPAYVDQGGACVFGGAPLNHEMSDPAVWTANGAGASVDTAAPGNINAGEVVLDRTGMCGYASLSQRFTMPPRDRSQPFKLVVTHRYDTQGGGSTPTLALQVGGQWMESSASFNVYRTDTFCLGASAYGGDIDFRVASFGGCSGGGGGNQISTLKVDQMEVRVASAGECPEPGSAINGDMEAGANWTFVAGIGGTAAYVAGAGEGGTRGAQLATSTRCGTATVTGEVSFAPAATPNQAIEVSMNATPGARVLVRIGNKGFATITGTGAERKFRMCVPTWARGTIAALSFNLNRSQNTTCAAQVRTVDLDSVRLVTEPTCAEMDLTDPGFERIANVSGPAPAWTLINAFVNDLEPGLASIVNNAGGARTGSGYLRVTTNNECASNPTATTAFIVPPSAGAAGPAVKFWVNGAVGNTQAVPTVQIGASGGTVATTDLPNTGAYAEHTVCIPPALSGRQMEMSMGLRDPTGGGCMTPIATQIASYDDVQTTTDAACPAQ